jgi:hypothetical protein
MTKMEDKRTISNRICTPLCLIFLPSFHSQIYLLSSDFRPGGKFGPPAIDVGAARDALTGVAFEESEDMRNASKVL